MNHVLSLVSAERLAQFAWSRVLLAFDFDGTLAPIVADRDDAWMRDRTHALFRRLCHLYPCAVISGRSRQDVARRLDGLAVRYIVGNHGIEPGARMPLFENQIASILPQLSEALRDVSGVDIEDKGVSVAIHYRKSRRKRDTRKAIHAAIATLPLPMRTVPGKLVVNVIPGDAPHKGDSLVRLRGQAAADTAIYVGDDATDEDVFELDQPGRLLTVRIGRSRSSAAAYFLRDQREIDSFLSKLTKLREKMSAR